MEKIFNLLSKIFKRKPDDDENLEKNKKKKKKKKKDASIYPMF